VNLDLYPAPGVTCLHDARRGLPFEDDSVRAIFTEHVLEHLDYTEEVPSFLSHCLRVLEPGGLLRIVVPDAERYLRAYVQGTWEPLFALRPLADQRDHWLGGRYHTRMEVINAVFRQGIEHHFAYDAETLCFALEHAGFHGARQCAFGESQAPDACLDNAGRASESLYVEATK
jgi:predicted SAM-dependent methyltransferase